jgi:hypothetical protein
VTRLPAPAIDDQVLLDAVVEERQNGIHAAFFTGIRDEWKQRAVGYRDQGGNPEVIQPWQAVAPRSKTFKNLYTSPGDGSAQSEILSTLRARTLQLCPACGEDGTPYTLDHYLPKELYPEFAILPHNLFPMCDRCQGEKGVVTVDDQNQRMFLHPYYDHFTEVQLVTLHIGTPFSAPASIELLANQVLSPAHQALVSRHVLGLAIVNRYHHFFRHEYLHLIKIVKQIRSKEQNVLDSLELFRDLALMKSINSWRHIFYDGVLASEGLLTFLKHEDLSEYV